MAESIGAERAGRDLRRLHSGWGAPIAPAAEPTGAAPTTSPGRPTRRLGRVPAPGTLAASVVAAGLSDVDLGIQRLPARQQRRGPLQWILGFALLVGVVLGLSGLVSSLGLPAAGSRTGDGNVQSAPPASTGVDLESQRGAAAAMAPSAPSGTVAPGGVAVSIRPVESNYTVVQGDTLERIAQRYGTTVDALVGMNNLPDRNSLRVGQKLIIP
jgi:hypothetical protein